MKEKLEQLVNVAAGFQTLVESFTQDSIIENFNYSDKEYLKQISKRLRDVGESTVPYRISLALSKLREEEHPEVLGVRYFPEIINKLEYLDDQQKIYLDEKLGQSRPQYFLRVSDFTKDYRDHELNLRVAKDLWTAELINPNCAIDCPNCGEETLIYVSINDVKNKGIDQYINDLEEVELWCSECDDGLDDTSYVRSEVEKWFEDELSEEMALQRSLIYLIGKPDLTIDSL